MKQITAAILFLALALQLHAQYGELESSSLSYLKGKELRFILLEPTTASLIKMKDNSEATAEYKEAVINYNDMVKAAASQWTGYKPTDFMTTSEYESALKDNNSRYVYVEFSPFDGSKFDDSQIGSYYADGVEYNSTLRAKAREAGYGVFKFTVIRSRNPEVIYSINNPVGYPSAADWHFAVKFAKANLDTHLNNRGYEVDMFDKEMKANHRSMLKETSMLVALDQLEDGLTEADVRSVIGNRAGVVDYSTVAKAILEDDTNYTASIIIPRATYPYTDKDKLPLAHFLFNTGNMKVYSNIPVRRTSYGEYVTRAGSKELKEYTD